MTDDKHARYFDGDPYQLWRDRLNGKYVEISPQYAETGFCGRWKLRRKHDSPWDRLAIWPVSASVYAYQFNDERAVMSTGLPIIRGFAYADPATVEEYNHHVETGVWPGEVSGLKRNIDDVSEYDQFKDNIDDLVREAMKWLKEHPKATTQAECDVAANYRASLTKLAKRAEEVQKKEYDPLKLAADDCKKKWVSIITPASDASTKMRSVAEAFLVAQKKAAVEEAARIQAIADKERRELEDQDIVLAALSPTVKVTPRKVTAGGQIGRKMGVREVWSGVIEDYELVLAHFKDHQKVREVIDSLVQAAARSKEKPAISGVKYVSEDKVI